MKKGVIEGCAVPIAAAACLFFYYYKHKMLMGSEQRFNHLYYGLTCHKVKREATHTERITQSQ